MQQPIEASIAYGKPPCQFILEDPGWKKWTKWDLRIANAFQVAKDAETNGWPAHIDQSPRVKFEVKERKSKSQEALDRYQHAERKRMEGKKNATPKFGVIPVVLPVTIDGGPMPTRQEWIEEQREKNQTGTKKLSSGKVVKTAADPEKMAAARKKMQERRSRRPASKSVD